MCAALALSASAQAEPGRRMCGQWAALPNGAGYIAVLIEIVRSESNGDHCDFVEKMSTGFMQQYLFTGTYRPLIPNLSWTHVREVTCESVGKNFISADHPKEDMCQYMEGYYAYTVVKDSTKNTTTYNQKHKSNEKFELSPSNGLF
jgi:hypothetical protein